MSEVDAVLETIKVILAAPDKPFADVGKWLGALFTAWMPALPIDLWGVTFDLKAIAAYWIYDAFKIVALVALTSYLMSVIRQSMPRALLDRWMSADGIGGAMAGAMFGVVTPVCSCTIVPLYQGLLRSGASTRASAAYLITGCGVNEFAIYVLLVVGGMKAAAIYVAFGFAFAIAFAWVAGRMGFDAERIRAASCGGSPHLDLPSGNRFVTALNESLSILRRMWFPLVIAGLLAAVLVPLNRTPVGILIANAATEWWWIGPMLAALLAIPLDMNAAIMQPFMIPLMRAVPMGTALSFMAGATFSSIPEIALLKNLAGARTTAVFVALLFVYLSTVGMVVNLVSK